MLVLEFSNWVEFYLSGHIFFFKYDKKLVIFRDYWLQCFEESVDKFIARAIVSQPQSPTAKDRASKLKEKYINRLHYLHLQPL